MPAPTGRSDEAHVGVDLARGPDRTEVYAVDLRRLLACRLRIMAAEADLLLEYARCVSSGGDVHAYLGKLGDSLRGRTRALEAEAPPR